MTYPRHQTKCRGFVTIQSIQTNIFTIYVRNLLSTSMLRNSSPIHLHSAQNGLQVGTFTTPPSLDNIGCYTTWKFPVRCARCDPESMSCDLSRLISAFHNSTLRAMSDDKRRRANTGRKRRATEFVQCRSCHFA